MLQKITTSLLLFSGYFQTCKSGVCHSLSIAIPKTNIHSIVVSLKNLDVVEIDGPLRDVSVCQHSLSSEM